MFSWYHTMSYVGHTISYVNIRHSINIRYRTFNIVRPVTLYRIYYIVYTIWHTTSNSRPMISYIRTYDIVGDIRYSMWQESRCGGGNRVDRPSRPDRPVAKAHSDAHWHTPSSESRPGPARNSPRVTGPVTAHWPGNDPQAREQPTGTAQGFGFTGWREGGRQIAS